MKRMGLSFFMSLIMLLSLAVVGPAASAAGSADATKAALGLGETPAASDETADGTEPGAGEEEPGAGEEEPGTEPVEPAKTIFIGDSRTVGMYSVIHGNTGNQFSVREGDEYWVCANGTRYDWMEQTAAPEADPYVGEGTNVVILMGVNDLIDTDDYTPYLTKYAGFLNKQAKAWNERGAKVYYVTVNPTGDPCEEETGAFGKATNQRIQQWNAAVNAATKANVGYLDTYGLIRNQYYTYDKLHYNADTYRMIYNIIVNTLNGTHEQVFARDSQGIWSVMETGKVVTDYQGLFKQNANNWYVIKDGQLDAEYQGVVQDNGVSYWAKDGKVDFGENRIQWTGKEWLKFTKGKEDRSFQTIGYNDAGFWKCKNGVVDFGFNQISFNDAGFWKCKNGKVDFGYNGIGYNEAGWWKCNGGKVDFNFTGVGYNDAGWWYCNHGKVDFKYNGLGSNAAGIWVIKSGAVDFKFNGVYRFNNSVFAVSNGKVVS